MICFMLFNLGWMNAISVTF